MGRLEPGQELLVGDLQETHELYEANVNEWRFLMAAYEGTRRLVDAGYLYRNERESYANWVRRCKEAAGFDYTKSIVDLFNFYLFKKPVKRDMGPLKKDKSWQAFYKDCNLYGDSFDDFLTEQGRYASIEGFVGILVDRPSVKYENKADELKEGIYAYLAAYFPTMILDWEYERDKNNRPFLSYLKLLDDDGQYRLWWRGKWEIWELPDEVEAPTTVEKGKAVKSNVKGVKKDSGTYELEDIPFVWLQNLKTRFRPIGMSDVHEVSRLDVSILRNLSQGEEVISYAAFPMLVKPMREVKPDGNPSATNDDVGVQAIMEFDPEHPESKPDWLSSAAKEPVDAILLWISKKVDEIYRVVNAGGMASTEISKDAKSGVALKTEFQLLNSALVRKAKNLEKAERDIIHFWCQWEKQESAEEKITTQRDRTYDVEDLAGDLENVLTSSIIVRSKKFNDEMQKKVVRQMMPAAENEALKEIDEEIENAEEIEPEVDEEDMDIKEG